MSLIRTAFLAGKHEGLKCLIGTVFESKVRLYYSGKKMIRLDYWSIIHCNNFLHYSILLSYQLQISGARQPASCNSLE
jgi:hypothetical protein